jgi:hypothetical protein
MPRSSLIVFFSDPCIATEFVHLITAEANEHCLRDNKKLITAEYILRALEVCFSRSLLVFISKMRNITHRFSLCSLLDLKTI